MEISGKLCQALTAKKITMETLAKILRKTREELGHSQRWVADRAGISNTSLRKIEEGITKKPEVETLARLAKALRLSFELLMEKAGYLPETNKEEYLYIPPEMLDGLDFKEREEAKRRALDEVGRVAETIRRYKPKEPSGTEKDDADV